MAATALGPVGLADRVELVADMRLTLKFIAALIIGVALVALIQGLWDYRRERDVFDTQMRSEAAALGRALARGMVEVWNRDGEAAELARTACGHERAADPPAYGSLLFPGHQHA